ALLHTWARGRGAMPLVSFMFLRDLLRISMLLFSSINTGVILRGALIERGPKLVKDKRQKESSKSSKKQ
ncbi:hypothetical protein ACJX0J_031930, partial [Zea mays]